MPNITYILQYFTFMSVYTQILLAKFIAFSALFLIMFKFLCLIQPLLSKSRIGSFWKHFERGPPIDFINIKSKSLLLYCDTSFLLNSEMRNSKLQVKLLKSVYFFSYLKIKNLT